MSKRLAEKECNEKHVVARIATATAQAKTAALAQYAPLVALSRSIAVATGHITEGSGPPESTNDPCRDAGGVPVPDSANWKDMPQAPVTYDNVLDWRRWVTEQSTHMIDMKTLVSLLNFPGFSSALRATMREVNHQECYACGNSLSEHAVAPSKKSRHRKSHLDAAGNITGVASGECSEGLGGTCGGCLSHRLNYTKHALRM